MRSVSVRLADLDRVKINLGIAGENEHTHVLFDCKKAFDQYPNATPFLIVTPPRGDIYPAVVTRDGDIVEWVVTDSDLIYHGNGKVQLQFKQGEIIMKSYEAMTSIAKSSEPTGTVPTPIQNWITQANAILASIPDDIAAALAEAKDSGQFDGVGIASIAYKSTSGLVDTYTITLTDGNDYDFTVANGRDGVNGVGIQGIAKTGTVGLVDTYTITLTNGQTYDFTVTNGQGSSIVIDDVTPASDKVFSSAKVAKELTDVKNAIQGKPELKETDAENVDLDITDSDGDVLVRFKDGHIQTKEFNSKKIIAVKPTDAVGSDMDVADENGNVLLRMKDGEVITKNFNSGTDCKRVVNPYKEVIFGSDEEVSITTHDHAKDQTAVDNLMSKNLDAIAISNYYPSEPYYPLSEYNLTVPAGTIEIPNAEHHSFTDDTSGAMHLNSIGSTFASGSPSGQTPLGVADTWRHGIVKMKRDLLFAEGGGVTINHPVWSGVPTAKVIEMLDFDDVVIGIEIYNQDSELTNGKGWAVQMWDDILKTGRRCWGFAVPDHRAEGSGSTNWEGKIVLLVPDATQENCLKAIRNGEFYIKIKHTSLALTDLEVEGNNVTIEVSESATIKTIIDGVVVDSSVGTTKNVTIPSKAVYVRFEAETANDKLFTNPIIFKGRK